MVDSNEIINSIKNDMVEQENIFNQIRLELEKLEQEHTTFEQNYLARKTQLEAGREQVRGSYTALYRQLEKFAKDELPQPEQAEPQDDNKAQGESKTLEENQPEPAKTEPKPTKRSTKKEQSGQPKEKVVAGLTAEEIAKINSAIPQQGKVDDNGNEIPDYLQTEYNK